MKTHWIALGGALGTVARYEVDGWIQNRLGTAFPWGTLIVNAAGSFLLLFLMHVGLELKLNKTRPFENGNVVLWYEPAE
jgi:fluoride ion exporter CrcB/FEX